MSEQARGEGKLALPRNILFISPTGALTNGAEIAGYQLMKHFVESGHSVTNAYSDNYRLLSASEAETYDSRMREARITSEKLNIGWWVPDDTENFLAEVLATRRLATIIEDRQIDLVITNTSNLPWGALAAAVTGTQHVWLLHEFPTHNFAWLKDKYDFISEFSDRVFCASKTLTEYVAREVAVVGGSTPVSSFYPYASVDGIELLVSRSGVPRFVCIGTIDAAKNQAEIVRALGILAHRAKATRLLFIGASDSPSYLAELRSLIDEQGLGDLCEICDFRSDPWSLVSKNDILVHASVSETFGMVACEAAKLGIPMILANNSGSTEISELLGVGKLYELGNVVELANVMERVVDDIEGERMKAVAAVGASNEVFSFPQCWQDVVAYVDAGYSPMRSRSLVHLKPYFANYVDDREHRIISREDAVGNQEKLLEDRLHLIHDQSVVVEQLYASKTWRIGQLLISPLAQFRDLGARLRHRLRRR